MKSTIIIGHRGASGHPENTIPAFELALEHGADGFELDVRKSGDGQLVVVHDAVSSGLAVQSSPYENIRDLGDGYEMPLFEDVLKAFKGRAFIDVELKVPGYEEEAAELLKTHFEIGSAMVSGFHTVMLNRVHKLLPDIQLGYIYNRTQDEELRHDSPVDFVIPQFRLASRELINDVHEEDLGVYAWTVNDEREMRRLLALGVDGIITDEPQLLAQVLGR